MTNGEATLTLFGCDGWQSEWIVYGIERVYTATLTLCAYRTGGLQKWAHCGLNCEFGGQLVLKMPNFISIDLDSRKNIARYYFHFRKKGTAQLV